MRLRKNAGIDPEAARELETLDAALRGEAPEGGQRDLWELALDIRAERPLPSHDFVAELDSRVRSGFAEPARPSAFARLRRSPRTAPLVAGSAASVLIVVAGLASLGVFGGDGGRRDSAPPDRVIPLDDGAGAERLAKPSPSAEPAPGGPPGAGGSSSGSADSPATSPPLPPSDGTRVAPGARKREKERQASLTLATSADDVADVADGVVRITDRYRGFVLSSSVSDGADGRAGASLDLRIPSDRAQSAIADLSELAHVRARTQSEQDVTASFVSLRTRLRDALAERRRLLRRLEAAQTDNEAAAIRARLRLANRRIARVRADFRAQRSRIDYAAVSVAVEGDRRASGDGRWTFGDALHDAGTILTTAFALMLVALAVLVPIALLALVTLLVSRRLASVRRERVLDSSVETGSSR
jgi:hypothetical protein